MNAHIYSHGCKSVKLEPFGEILTEFFKSLRVDNKVLAQEPGDRSYFYHFAPNVLKYLERTSVLKVTLLPA